jgi:hypothetical protein
MGSGGVEKVESLFRHAATTLFNPHRVCHRMFATIHGRKLNGPKVVNLAGAFSRQLHEAQRLFQDVNPVCPMLFLLQPKPKPVHVTKS